MAFWGCALKPGQKHQVAVSAAEVLHLSQACLHQPGAGKSYLQVTVDGKTYTIGCLEKDKVETLALDLFFSAPPTFVNTGKSEIHLSGYTEPKGTGEDMDDEDGESEKAAPKAAAAKVASPKVAAAAASPKVAAAASPKVAAAEAAKKASQKAAPAKGKAAAEDEDEDEESEEEEGEESEEEPPAKAAPPAKKGKETAAPEKKKEAAAPEKRKASEAASPPPAKKAKDAAGGAKAAAAGSPKAGAASGDEAGYVKAVVDYLKQKGKTKVAELGSKVKRPEGVPKMKVVFAKYADKFVVDGETVAAK